MTTLKTTTAEYTIDVDGLGVDVTHRGETLTIEPADLIAGGWQHEPRCERDHCDEGDCPGCSVCANAEESDVRDLWRAAEQWHNDEHESVLRFCTHPLCVAVGRAMGVRFA